MLNEKLLVYFKFHSSFTHLMVLNSVLIPVFVLSAAFKTDDQYLTTVCFESYLSDRFQFVSSSCRKVSNRVLQSSVLEPILFILYMLPQHNVIRKHCIHFL